MILWKTLNRHILLGTELACKVGDNKVSKFESRSVVTAFLAIILSRNGGKVKHESAKPKLFFS